MRSIRHESLSSSEAAATVFDAALGVVQHDKRLHLLAVHREGRKLVAFEKSKMSNAKIYVIAVEEGVETALLLAVGTDPRTSKAMMDGKFNQRSATKFIEAVRDAVSGAAPAPATPVANHYIQRKNEIPWDDPNVEPDIDLGFSWLGIAKPVR